MANKKITDATTATSVAGTDKVFLNQGGDLKQVDLNSAVANSQAVQTLNSNLTWKSKYNYINTTSDKYIYSGISFTFTKASNIYLDFSYANVMCVGFAITIRSDVLNNGSLRYMQESQVTDMPLYMTPIFCLPAGTYYIFLKHKSTLTSAKETVILNYL